MLRIIDPARLRGYAVIAATSWLLVGGMHDLDVVLIFLPAAALFGALLLGKRPGETLITRLREARRPRRVLRRAFQSTGRPAERRRVAGGTLLARRLAGRAPPQSSPTTA